MVLNRCSVPAKFSEKKVTVPQGIIHRERLSVTIALSQLLQ